MLNNFHNQFLRFLLRSCWFFNAIFVVWLLRLQRTQLPPLATLTSTSSSLTTTTSLRSFFFPKVSILGEIYLRFSFNKSAMTELFKTCEPILKHAEKPKNAPLVSGCQVATVIVVDYFKKHTRRLDAIKNNSDNKNIHANCSRSKGYIS